MAGALRLCLSNAAIRITAIIAHQQSDDLDVSINQLRHFLTKEFPK
jgi:hypothetical protein